MMTRTCLLAAFILCGLIAFLPAQDIPVPTEQAVDACSIIGAAIANSDAWETGDVLIRLTDSFDNVSTDAEKPVGTVFSRTDYLRFQFDNQSGMHLRIM